MGEQLVGQRFLEREGRPPASIGYSGSKALLPVQGQYVVHKGQPATAGGLDVYDLPRHPKRGIMPESLEYDLEQIL